MVGDDTVREFVFYLTGRVVGLQERLARAEAREARLKHALEVIRDDDVILSTPNALRGFAGRVLEIYERDGEPGDVEDHLDMTRVEHTVEPPAEVEDGAVDWTLLTAMSFLLVVSVLLLGWLVPAR